MLTEERTLEQIQRLIDKLDQYIENTNQILHSKRIPLEIWATCPTADQTNLKVVVGCVRNRRVNNHAVQSFNLKQWQRIWSGFDDDEPFVMNMSSQIIRMNFDGETSETDNVSIELPTKTLFVYPGLILPVAGWP